METIKGVILAFFSVVVFILIILFVVVALFASPLATLVVLGMMIILFLTTLIILADFPTVQNEIKKQLPSSKDELDFLVDEEIEEYISDALDSVGQDK